MKPRDTLRLRKWCSVAVPTTLLIMRIRNVSFSALVLASLLAACSSAVSGPTDYSSEDSEYRIDYESGMMWAYDLAADLVEEAEEAGSQSPRYDGFSSATSQMIELYGGFQEGCLAVVEYWSFGDEFPEGPSRDAWVQGCSTYMEQIKETAASIAP